ncbi:MAG TPA: hypothetical protein VIG49_15555 [Acetobacteraceae bacterium]
MLAVGCLIPILLIVVGAAAGWAIGGQVDAAYGAVGGGIIGTIAMLGLVWGWDRIRNRGL